MHKKFLLIAILMATLSSIGFGQSDKDKNKSGKQDNSFAPSTESSTVTAPAKKARKKKNQQQFQMSMEEKVKEFEKRMESNAKAYKKQQKEMQKPQYSDPSYFGHKRKPKKRKVGNRKFCKECGIVH